MCLKLKIFLYVIWQLLQTHFVSIPNIANISELRNITNIRTHFRGGKRINKFQFKNYCGFVGVITNILLYLSFLRGRTKIKGINRAWQIRLSSMFLLSLQKLLTTVNSFNFANQIAKPDTSLWLQGDQTRFFRKCI